MGLKPGDLILRLRKGGPPAAGYLFLGAEPFYRGRCHQALRKAALGKDPDESAIAEVDLDEFPLTALVEEARTMSLFGGERLVIGRNAEGAVPKTASAASKAEQQILADYFADPVPDTVVIVEAVAFDSREHREKARLVRVGKHFSAVPVRVELEALSLGEARYVAKVLAQRVRLRIAQPVLNDFVDMLGADAFRIEHELEKLALYVGGEREVTAEDLDLLVPEARQTGVFEFSQAVADRDRARALRLLDRMSRTGIYWPMQLNLIAGLFRQALAAKELGLRDERQIAARFGPLGLRTWPSRSRQIAGMVARFREDELRRALVLLFETDRGLKGPQPEERLLMETAVMKLTD